MRNIFENLGPDDITVHVMLNLQDRYPDLDEEALSSYRSRVELRVSLLREFAEKNNLSLGIDCICLAITDVERMLLKGTCRAMGIPGRAAPLEKDEEKWVILFNGGPGTGKSRRIRELDLPADTIVLDRDALFDRLPPYPRLKKEYPDCATHAVASEAILYNERDAYRYAILRDAGHLLVDSTMSHLDLGLEMIEFAQTHGYYVTVINMDCPIDEGLRRMEKRAAETGKTINHKLLYESHVRCAFHFSEYRKVADATENWHNDADIQDYLIAYTKKQPDGTIKETIKDKAAFEALKHKSTLPLDNPCWSANFDEFLEQRTGYLGSG